MLSHTFQREMLLSDYMVMGRNLLGSGGYQQCSNWCFYGRQVKKKEGCTKGRAKFSPKMHSSSAVKNLTYIYLSEM